MPIDTSFSVKTTPDASKTATALGSATSSVDSVKVAKSATAIGTATATVTVT